MATTFSTATKYSPISGLITDNNYNQYQTGLTAPKFVSSNTTPNVPAPNNSVPGGGNFAQSITGVGSYTPDWASLIANDAGLKAAQAAIGANTAQNQDQLNAEIANAYEQFGSNVDLADLAQKLGMSQADLQNVITPAIRQLAQENTNAGLSTQARLDQQNTIAKRNLTNDLNRRGILHSGEAGYQLDQLNTGYRQAQSDAYQKLLGYLNQYQQGYLQAQNANTGNLTDAINAAATRQAGMNQGSAGYTINFAGVDSAGRPFYRAPDGSLVNADGSPYSAPASAPAAPQASYNPDSPNTSTVQRALQAYAAAHSAPTVRASGSGTNMVAS